MLLLPDRVEPEPEPRGVVVARLHMAGTKVSFSEPGPEPGLEPEPESKAER